MATIRLHIHVAPDHTISGVAPADLPAGDHEVVISTAPAGRPRKPFRYEGFPIDDRPWDGRSLRREDMYGDDGR